MADDIDAAQVTEERLREGAIGFARDAVATGRLLPSALTCRACGEGIDENRRRAVPGVQTCVHCQETRERLHRLFGVRACR